MSSVFRRSAPILIPALAAATAVFATLRRAPSYRPPLDQPSSPVSSFAEYRTDHLHPGVDLSTGGRTGLPVFAVADGAIYRLKVEWRGYGRALYLRHADGRISVYAHLERFEERGLGLETRVDEARQARATRYPGDIYLDPPVSVRRGRRIATTGESGAGLPHLHFELRRDEQRPADPSPALGASQDSVSLRFETLYLIPRGPEVLVQGARWAEIPFARDKAGVFVPSSSLVVTGPFLPEAGIVVEDRSGHRFGISGISTRLDGRTVYQTLLRDFRFDEYPQVGLLLDHALSSMVPPLFTYRLARLPGNSLGKTPTAPEAPWPDLLPGAHEIEVAVTGAFGGSAKARIPFRLVSPPKLHWREEDGKSDDQLRLTLSWEGGTPEGLPALRVVYRRAGSTVPVACRLRQPFATGESCSFDLAGNGSGLAATLLAGDIPVARALKVFPLSRDVAPEPPPLRVLPRLDSVDFQVASSDPESPLPSRLVFKQADRETVRDFTQGKSQSLETTLSLALWRAVREVEMEWAASPRPLRSRVALLPHTGDPTSDLRIQDCGIRLEIPAHSLFSPTALACEIDENPPPLPGEGILLRSRVVRFLPAGLPFATKAKLIFPRPGGSELPERLGIYRVASGRGNWTFLGGESSGAELSVAVGRLDSYALLEDGSPPRIIEVLPSPGNLSASSRLRFSVKVEDQGSGMNYDGVHLELDGREVEMEFDPDRGIATGACSDTPPPGAHTVSLWAVDRAGNRTTGAPFQLTLR